MSRIVNNKTPLQSEVTKVCYTATSDLHTKRAQSGFSQTFLAKSGKLVKYAWQDATYQILSG